MVLRNSLRPAVLAARGRLTEGRAKLRAEHEAGAPGAPIVAAMTDLVDAVVLELYQQMIADLQLEGLAREVALVAHGGYGRRDQAPYSDVDLMLVPSPRIEAQIAPLAGRIVRDLGDAGLQLGFSVRTPAQACAGAWQDVAIFTSLAESRLLAGSIDTFGRFMYSLRLGTGRRRQRLLQMVDQARREERLKWGETVYLLCPNVKRSRGGLRDIQLIRWLGFARYGEVDLERLQQTGALPEDDFHRVQQAQAMLLRLRNELHFMAGKSHDLLDRPTQMVIAQRWGYPGEQVLPVEQFMRAYFERTREVRYAAANFFDTVRHRSPLQRSWERALARTVDGDFRIGRHHIWVRERALARVASDLPRVLQLMNLANRYHRRIAHPTWLAIRNAMRDRPLGLPDEATVASFLALLSRPGHLADLLRRLHELRVLEQILPAMRHAWCLLQFNEYHKYTVDGHSIRAVEAATQLQDAPGMAGDLYRRIRDKRLLHLALLIHDLGKGFDEDHSVVGARIAEETAQLYQLPAEATQQLVSLVRHHLLMSETALRHDLNDPEIVVGFAAKIGSLETLEMLLVMTVADLTAVGPGVLTDWKLKLLEELYTRTRRYLRSGRLPGEEDAEVAAIRESIRQKLIERGDPPVCFSVLSELPSWFIEQEATSFLLDGLQRIGQMTPEHSTLCWDRYLEELDATEYTVITRQQGNPIGTFARVTGALTGRGLEILRSEIDTLPSGIAWDRFTVRDDDFEGPPPPQRVAEICAHVRESLSRGLEDVPSFRRLWHQRPSAARRPELELLPTRVTFDNATSDRYTVIYFFAYDRPGLLYAVARSLARHQVVLHFAKIDTHLDQAVDVFYVTELDEGKIEAEARQQAIRDDLLRAAERPVEPV